MNPRSRSTGIFIILCAMIILVSNVECCRVITSIEESPLFNRTNIIDWIFTNFTSSVPPLSGACVSFNTLTAAMYPYEDTLCLYRYNNLATQYLASCDVDHDGNICYNTVPSSPTCGCLGTKNDYVCALAAVTNKAMGKIMRQA